MDLTPEHETVFEAIKRLDPRGIEFWDSRQLAAALGYVDYESFPNVVAKAKIACEESGYPALDHFREVPGMVDIGSGASREVTTTLLSRYACYLAVQNADPRKPMVARGQTYFAFQTRRQELASRPDEDGERLRLRDEVRTQNKNLASTAKVAGVIEPRDYAIFQDEGYKGLYGGLKNKKIKAKKGLKDSQDLLDHVGPTELAANLFRITQAEEKIRKERIQGKESANRAHHEVGRKVRKAIKDIGGTMPEELPTYPSIKALERQKAKEIRAVEEG